MTSENNPFEKEGKLVLPDQDSKYWDAFKSPGQIVVCDFLKDDPEKNILDLVRKISASDSRAAFGHYCSNQIKPCTNVDLDKLSRQIDVLSRDEEDSFGKLDPSMFKVIVSGAITLVGATIECYNKETGEDMKSVFKQVLDEYSS